MVTYAVNTNLPTTSQASELCLECGLCCQGVLHKNVILEVEAIPLLEELGVPTYAEGDGYRFDLPCPLFNGKCSIYHLKRPATCGSYQCKLMKAYIQGQISLEEGLQIVRRAKGLVANLQGRLKTDDQLQRMWETIQEDWNLDSPEANTPEFRCAHAKDLLALAALSAYLKNHFFKPKELTKKGPGS